MDRNHPPFSRAAGAATEHIPDAQPPVLFAGFRLQADGSLFRGNTPIHLQPRELAALRLLLANAGHIVTPAEIKRTLWGEVNVTADSVPKCLSSLRARLQPDDCIQTVYKRGYRMTADVQQTAQTPADAPLKLAIPPFVHDFGVPPHLGTTIAEEAIVRLSNAKQPQASIMARDSVFTLAMQGLTALQIGEALHADLVLAGTIRSLISHFRLRVEMIRVSDGVQIWVEDLLVERSRLGGVESDLANRLAFRLKCRVAEQGELGVSSSLPPGRNGRFAQSEPSGATNSHASTDHDSGFTIAASAAEDISGAQRFEAYEGFMRGHHEWQTLERHRMQDGLRHLVRAIELDPSLTAAKVDLVHLCVTQAYYGFMSPATAGGIVHSTVESIPDFPRQGRAMLPALAWTRFHFDRNLRGAIQDFDRCADLPHASSITRLRAVFAMSRRRFDEAISILRAAYEVDPFSACLISRLAWALHLAGRAKESLQQVERAIRLFPKHESTCLYGAIILAFNGELAQAVELAEGLAQRQPYFDLASGAHAYALACAGSNAKARAILERMDWLSRERFVLRSLNPAVYVALGDYDTAMTELSAANDTKCPWFFQMLADPRLKPLHGRAAFHALQAIPIGMERAATNA